MNCVVLGFALAETPPDSSEGWGLGDPCLVRRSEFDLWWKLDKAKVVLDKASKTVTAHNEKAYPITFSVDLVAAKNVRMDPDRGSSSARSVGRNIGPQRRAPSTRCRKERLGRMDDPYPPREVRCQRRSSRFTSAGNLPSSSDTRSSS